MNTELGFPSFDERLSKLNQFIVKLTEDYNEGDITSWDDLDERVKKFFTLEQMNEMENIVPGWKEMASYSDGITLTHVTCVFLGLFMLPEFKKLSNEQQQLVKWIVLFHDLSKIHISGQRDDTHALRSAILTANILPNLGFPVSSTYQTLIHTWSEATASAVKDHGDSKIQDKSKIAEILAGINNMFGEDTPTAMIVKGVLFHMSINAVKDWPQTAPLSDEEIRLFLKPNLIPLIKVMMLADNEGWTIFHPDRIKQREETLEVFERIESMITEDTRS